MIQLLAWPAFCCSSPSSTLSVGGLSRMYFVIFVYILLHYNIPGPVFPRISHELVIGSPFRAVWRKETLVGRSPGVPEVFFYPNFNPSDRIDLRVPRVLKTRNLKSPHVARRRFKMYFPVVSFLNALLFPSRWVCLCPPAPRLDPPPASLIR